MVRLKIFSNNESICTEFIRYTNIKELVASFDGINCNKHDISPLK